MTKRLVIFVIFFCFISLISCSYVNANSSVGGKIGIYLAALQLNKNFNGAVLVAQNGKILKSAGYGFTDYEHKIKNTPKTIFPLASLSKQFTAMAIMQLYEKGSLDLEDKLSKYIPDYPRGNEISIYQLLTHTSGITCDPILSKHFISDNIIDVINTFKNLPLLNNPGEKYGYSNCGYILLSYIIENITGNTYADYIKANIFEPLGMNNSGSFCTGKDIQVQGYASDLDFTGLDIDYMINRLFGAGGLYSTVEDLYLWDKALYTDKLVSKKTIDKIFTPNKSSYGLGWFVFNNSLGKTVHHGGHVNGFSSSITRYIDKNTAIIILSNNDVVDMKSISDSISNILFKGTYVLPKAKKASIKLDSKIYNDFVGQYKFARGATIIISSAKGKLFCRASNKRVFEMCPESKDAYFLKDADFTISFIRNNNKKVTKLYLNNLSKNSTAQKMSNNAPLGKDPVDVSTKDYSDFTGLYKLTNGIDVKIFIENKQLIYQTACNEKLIICTLKSELFIIDSDTKIIFNKDSDRKIIGFTVSMFGSNYKSDKLLP